MPLPRPRQDPDKQTVPLSHPKQELDKQTVPLPRPRQEVKKQTAPLPRPRQELEKQTTPLLRPKQELQKPSSVSVMLLLPRHLLLVEMPRWLPLPLQVLTLNLLSVLRKGLSTESIVGSTHS